MRHVESDFILHFPFWNSFPWEVNSFPELENIKELEAVYCIREQILIFVPGGLAEIQSLRSTDRGVHVCKVSGQQPQHLHPK
jgi:hypothetical protein